MSQTVPNFEGITLSEEAVKNRNFRAEDYIVINNIVFPPLPRPEYRRKITNLFFGIMGSIQEAFAEKGVVRVLTSEELDFIRAAIDHIDDSSVVEKITIGLKGDDVRVIRINYYTDHYNDRPQEVNMAELHAAMIKEISVEYDFDYEWMFAFGDSAETTGFGGLVYHPDTDRLYEEVYDILCIEDFRSALAERKRKEEYGLAVMKLHFQGEGALTPDELAKILDEQTSVTPIFDGELNREAMAEALKTAMEERGLSVRDAAAEVGLSKDTIQNIRNGTGSLDKATTALEGLGYRLSLSIEPIEPEA